MRGLLPAHSDARDETAYAVSSGAHALKSSR